MKQKGRRRSRWIALSGAVLGLLVWTYDYDFFVNAGGPATPISNAILRILHLQDVPYPFQALLPLSLLVSSGIGLGAVAGRITSPPQNQPIARKN